MWPQPSRFWAQCLGSRTTPRRSDWLVFPPREVAPTPAVYPHGLSLLYILEDEVTGKQANILAGATGENVPDAYIFNDQAATLYHVKSEVDYISESPTYLDGNLADRIDQFTHTDRYQYILEVDADGKIIGEYRSMGLRPYTLDKAKQFGFDQAFLEACL